MAGSPTPSFAPTTSQASSASATPSTTPTLTQSSSKTGSPTLSMTASSPRSQTSSPTPSASLSATPSQTSSSTSSTSVSTTRSLTSSSAPWTSVSATRSQTSSSTTSTTITSTLRSQTSSLTPSASASSPLTRSASQTASRIQTTTTGVVLTTSATQDPSVTSSPEPFALLVSLTSAGPPIPSGGAVVSDSLPVVPILMWLSQCPLSNGLASAAVQCIATAGSPLFAAVGPTTAHAGASMSATLAASCQASALSPVLLAQTAWVGAFFSPVEPLVVRAAAVDCSITDSGTGQVLASASVPVTVIPTKWPLWVDAISVSAVGVMRSARIGVTVNATAALIDAAAATSADGNATLENALATPAAVMLAAQTLWGNTTLVPGGPSSSGFTLTLVGASRVVLRAAAGTPAFSFNSTYATVGSSPGNVSSVSLDGAWAVLDTPSAAQLCGSDSVECGYAPFTLANRATQSVRGASLSCPPFCPGAIGGGVVPVALNDGSASLGADPTSALGTLPTARLAPVSSSEGFYYTVRCSQTGLWTDPASGACANASDPASYNCAFGSGSSCAPCPAGALCPGGSRIWARTGYWVPSEGSTEVAPCAPPNAASRCAGWSAALGATQCGPEYLQGSSRCSACAVGYFIDESGTCKACPAVESVWQVSCAPDAEVGALCERVLVLPPPPTPPTHACSATTPSSTSA